VQAPSSAWLGFSALHSSSLLLLPNHSLKILNSDVILTWAYTPGLLLGRTEMFAIFIGEAA
jgi:hypothetical protein